MLPESTAMLTPTDADSPGSRTSLRWAQQQGIQLCRQGRWEAGLALLRRAVRAEGDGSGLPSLVYSYLGRGMALAERQALEGLALCQHALQRDPGEPENHLNLASILIAAGRKRAAFRALERGLAVAPDHPQLARLRGELGRRRRPVIPVWPRRHPLNRSLGRLRHRLLS